MKKTLSLALLLFVLCVAAKAQQAFLIVTTNQPPNVTVLLSYPGALSNTVFNVYASTNVATPMTNWAVVISASYTQWPIMNVGGTNYFSYKTNFVPQQLYMTAAASNSFWGLSSFFVPAIALPPPAVPPIMQYPLFNGQ